MEKPLDQILLSRASLVVLRPNSELKLLVLTFSKTSYSKVTFPPRTTAYTTTTTTTTTELPLEEEEEEEEEEEDYKEEDPQTIKQLINLIKKLGKLDYFFPL